MTAFKPHLPENSPQSFDISETRRPTVPALESLLFEPFRVLDHGFIRVVDYMGDDAAVVQAARVSYGRGTKRVSEDRNLISYLMRNNHSTPFEMCELKLHVKLPIFVARQWVRHRMANINEYSARYSVLDREFYVPDPEHLAAQSTSNKQGRGEVLTGDEASAVLDILRDDAKTCYDHYLELLNLDEEGRPIDQGRRGLARELARMNLTLNTYTQWYWKIDLHNLLNFLNSRLSKHAQHEIRVYAQVMMKIVDAWVPMTAEAFRTHRLGAATFSAPMVEVLRRAFTNAKVTQEDSGLSQREWADFLLQLDHKF